ncbi:MAG: hypothetical protein KDC38_07010, partial [Planctomycetes bacterium]|nr:hypothetical protein [Planctomycetota bacterium]
MGADSRDQLFLRLCVRQGIFNKDEAQQLFAYYRENAGAKEGVSHFLVREGYLEEPVAQKIDTAIDNRAEGHVVAHQRRVPKGVKTGAGHAHPHRHHHVPAQPTRVAADPMQLTLIGLGMVVAIVAVIWIVWEMNKGTSPDEIVAKSQAEQEAERKKRWEEEEAARKAAAREADAATAKASFSDADRKQAEDAVREAVFRAREALVDKGPKTCLDIISEERTKFQSQG